MLIDWYKSFRPALELLLSGGNPYHALGYFSPPWMLLPMLPFLWLPDILIVAIPILVIFFSIWRYTNDWRVAMLFAFSPPSILTAYNGASDWIPILGLACPPWLAVLLLFTKPQVGLFPALYLIWKDKRAAIPLLVLTVLSLIFYGPSPRPTYALEGMWNVAILWPYTIPLATCLVIYAWLHNPALLPAATLLLSPYFQPPSMWAFLLPVVKRKDPDVHIS